MPRCCVAARLSFGMGSNVDLLATATDASDFVGWNDNQDGNATCYGTGELDGNVDVTVTFDDPDVFTFTLTVTKTGSGSGTVTSQPAGIDCGRDDSTCSASFSLRLGTPITLTATAAPPESIVSFFGGWSGPCSGAGDCTFVTSGPTTVTANFEHIWTLGVDATSGDPGVNMVSSDPPGIDCLSQYCTSSFVDGTVVTLTATPDSGWGLLTWSDYWSACSGNGTCVVTMDRNRDITASFQEYRTLTFVSIGSWDSGTDAGDEATGGSGRITSSPAGIDCYKPAGTSSALLGTCSADFLTGSDVVFTLTPDADSQSWFNTCSGEMSECTTTIVVGDYTYNFYDHYDPDRRGNAPEVSFMRNL